MWVGNLPMTGRPLAVSGEGDNRMAGLRIWNRTSGGAYRNEYRIDVLTVACACVIAAGNAGSNACRSISNAASSSNEDPDVLTIAASITRPERSTVKRTETL